MSEFKVWVDQDLCTGDGLCVELAPTVFEMREDNLAYVLDPADKRRAPDTLTGPTGTVQVPDKLLDETIEAAEECPGECIFIEPVET